MPDAEPDTADRHLEATLADRRGDAGTRRWRSLASLAVGLLTGDAASGPSLTDLVVTRRATGAEVIRMSAGSPDEASRLLDLARRDLARLSVAEFVAEWQPAP